MSSATPTGALVIDANVAIAIVSKEVGRDAIAKNALQSYLATGYDLYAPGPIIPETLYVLCGKQSTGLLSQPDYALAVTSFVTLMGPVQPPPNGDRSLIARAVQIAQTYGCSRSADGIYIALAEELSAIRPTVLLTFDKDLPKQAAKNAPSITVNLL